MRRVRARQRLPYFVKENLLKGFKKYGDLYSIFALEALEDAIHEDLAAILGPAKDHNPGVPIVIYDSNSLHSTIKRLL